MEFKDFHGKPLTNRGLYRDIQDGAIYSISDGPKGKTWLLSPNATHIANHNRTTRLQRLEESEVREYISSLRTQALWYESELVKKV